MFGTLKQLRWDRPFPRTGCALQREFEYITLDCNTQHHRYTLGVGANPTENALLGLLARFRCGIVSGWSANRN
jgi:hypothetical protein